MNYAHITTNASPFVAGQPIDFFFTDKVTHVRDASTGGSPVLPALNRARP